MNDVDIEKNSNYSISFEERKKYINQYPIFCLLTPESIDKLALQMEELYVQPMETIVSEEEYFDAFYLIISGEASVSRSLKRIQKTNPRKIITLGPNDSIGLIESGFRTQHGLRTASVTAITPMLLLKVDLFKFYMFLNEHGSAYPSLKNSSERFLLLHIIHQTPFAEKLLARLKLKLPVEPESKPTSYLHVIKRQGINKELSPEANHKTNYDFTNQEMIFQQISDKNSLEEFLKNELLRLDPQKAHIIATHLKILGVIDSEFNLSQIYPTKDPILKKVVRKIVYYWKGKTLSESNK
jgi:CRP-like cAMP-binding protein